MATIPNTTSDPAPSPDAPSPAQPLPQPQTQPPQPSVNRRLNPNRQQTIGLLLLALVVPFVYFSQIRALFVDASTDAQVYIADLDYWQQTERETTVTTNAYFDLAHDLNNVPLTVGQWQGEDVPETNEEVMILLDPEQYIQRLYQRTSGEYLWLSMIGGRSSRPFHAPDICYDADGWQYELGSYPITLAGDGSLYGLWLHANKQQADATDPLEHVVFYFYLFPDSARRLSDGIVLFKLTSARYGTVEETLELQADFIRELFLGSTTPYAREQLSLQVQQMETTTQ